jgi:hypothetical protein
MGHLQTGITRHSSSIRVSKYNYLAYQAIGIEMSKARDIADGAANINLLDDVTAGTVAASKVIAADANKDVASFRNVTMTGELDAATLDLSGNADIDGVLETDGLSINGTSVTSTAAELNILDGVTSTAAELNILDGVTATAAELNILDGVTSTAAEINILDALSRGSLIYGNASAATAILTKGAANTVLTSDGTDIAWAAAGGGGLLGTQAFTGSGSWTVPSGVTKALVFCTGGGGGSNGQSNGGGSGGAGGTAIKLYTVAAGQSATVTIGSGGSNTSSGGNSTFVYDSTTITGNGGSAATSSTAGISGTASGGDVNLSGGAGTSGSNVRCPGGASFWGGGSQGATGNYQGPNANGALGSGAGSAGGNSSGTGKAGFVLIVF